MHLRQCCARVSEWMPWCPQLPDPTHWQRVHFAHPPVCTHPPLKCPSRLLTATSHHRHHYYFATTSLLYFTFIAIFIICAKLLFSCQFHLVALTITTIHFICCCYCPTSIRHLVRLPNLSPSLMHTHFHFLFLLIII